MAVLSASDLSAQMVAQLRLLNPTASAEVGTPERLIIDTVATQGANMQIDLTGLAGALDIDSKFGTNLDRFVGLFRFQRVQATQATGFVTFSCFGTAAAVITIPTGVSLRSQPDSNGHQVEFVTTITGSIAIGSSTSGLIPIQAVNPGANGNLAINLITIISNIGGLPGVSTVTNPAATSGGGDQEDDNSLKVRFKNTVFRNLAGTRDQFLALAISTAFSTKANVIGPVSTYQEYIQVPLFDDAGYSPGTTNAQPQTSPDERAAGSRGQYTTALSTIPYASAIYRNLPAFISTVNIGANNTFLRPGNDFVLNSPSRTSGDTYREVTGVNANLEPFDTGQPNVTFLNVFTGTMGGVTAAVPGSTYLLEYSYESSASRNDTLRNIANAVDVYVDGKNPQQSSVIFQPPSSSVAIFTDNPVSPYFLENFRRESSNNPAVGLAGSPVRRPVAGHFFTPLFHSPVISLPNTITVGDNTYTLGVHYILVSDITTNGGSIRARDGIEWTNVYPGVSAGHPKFIDGTTLDGSPNGWGPNDVVTVTNYTYDQNIQDLQAALEGSKQITTDVLAHLPRLRNFKLDVTVVYAAGATPSVVNLAIQQALQNYFLRQYFGTTVRLSDLLQTIHAISGVQNVRWTNDYPGNIGTNFTRVIETDEFGAPLLGTAIDQLQAGSGGRYEQWQLFINGNPQGGSFTITTHYGTTSPIPISVVANIGSPSAAGIQAAINALPGQPTVTVTLDARASGPSVVDPINSYTITFNATGSQTPIAGSLPNPIFSTTAQFPQGEYLYDWDFFLRDNELPQLSPGAIPGDTLAGLIVRPRAENTWVLPPVSSGLVLD